VNRSVSHAHRTVGAKPGSGFFSKRVYRHNSSFRYSFKFYFSATGLVDRRGSYQRLIRLMRGCCLSCQPMSLSSQGKSLLQPKLLQPRFARLRPAVSNQRHCRDHFLAVCPASQINPLTSFYHTGPDQHTESPLSADPQKRRLIHTS